MLSPRRADVAAARSAASRASCGRRAGPGAGGAGSCSSASSWKPACCLGKQVEGVPCLLIENERACRARPYPAAWQFRDTLTVPVSTEEAACLRATKLNVVIERSHNAIAEDCPSSSTVAPGSSYPLRRLRRASRRGAISELESRPGSRAAAASTINADEAPPVGY